MFDDEQIILNPNKNEQSLKIDENEWNFLKNTFGYTNELKVTSKGNNIYKIIVLDLNDRKNNLFFRPKYLILEDTETLQMYFQHKYNINNVKVYIYNNSLSKQHRKEVLFNIMTFFLFSNDNNFLIHEDIFKI